MWLRFALFGSLAVALLHMVVLVATGQDPVATPISQLSRYELGAVHTAGLLLFGAAHIALAVGLGRLDHGRMWPIARAVLAASGIALFYVAYYFATVSQETLTAAGANDPLWIVASLTGIAMGVLQPGLSRLSPQLGLFSALCLGIWLLLVPLILLVNEQWLGAYERIVGCVYVVWMAGISSKLLFLTGVMKSDASTPS
ncbi:MAG: DUF998 domain-containing protein [Pseudomonadota bacterium]